MSHKHVALISLFLKDSAGVQHLKRLSNAGITHVHLLPTYQFAGVEDEKHKWKYTGKALQLFFSLERGFPIKDFSISFVLLSFQHKL